MNFLDMLRNNPRGWGTGPGPEPEIAYQDDGGNLYGFNNTLIQKAPAPHQGFADQSLTDMLIGIGSAPAKMAVGLASGLSPYGSEGFQVPPLAADAWDAINAPGKILNEGMTKEDRDRNATNAAGFMMGGGLVAPKPTSTLGMFGGRMAKTADHAALAKAEELATKGAPREQIWNETGWFQGPDQKWRFEIDDSKSWLADWGFGSAQKAGNVMQHKGMFDAYPDLREVPMQGTISLDSVYNSGTDAMSVGMHKKDAALHEFQHAIQNREGFSMGGNVHSAANNHPGVKALDEKIAQLETRATDFSRPLDEIRSLDQEIRSLMAQKKAMKSDVGFSAYQQLAGEVEARNVQQRMNMSAEERKATPPWLTQDVADADQIVNLFSNGSKQGAVAGSSVVEGAKPIRAYHGTRYDIKGQFKPSDDGLFGPGVYSSKDINQADLYAGQNVGHYTDPVMSYDGSIYPFDVAPNIATKQDWLRVTSALGGNNGLAQSRGIAKQAQDVLRGEGYSSVSSGDTILSFDNGSIRSPLTGETLFSNGSKGGAAIGNSLIDSQGQKGFTVYHGSPHDFDKFSLDKIGTGEGAQAYGHGLYFADNEGVAKSYRNKLSNDGHYVDWKDLTGRTISDTNPADAAAVRLRKQGDNRESAIRSYESELQTASDQYKPDWLGRKNPYVKTIEDAMNHLRSGTETALEPPSGKMYQVRINADPESFLDWDKPLSQQSEAVQSLVQQDPMWIPPLNEAPDNLMRNLLRDRETTNKLREAGVPGVRYLDGASRADGAGSSNYVVFDDSLIDILRKYGLAGGAVGAGALNSLSQDPTTY